mmetsp:Transcript_10027/g.15245  ORF Transcript_10027/g.15245 Transcript_10027/m.15245 type:complete len:84 (+) Transcript_10027:2843-3094(+)
MVQEANQQQEEDEEEEPIIPLYDADEIHPMMMVEEEPSIGEEGFELNQINEQEFMEDAPEYNAFFEVEGNQTQVNQQFAPVMH